MKKLWTIVASIAGVAGLAMLWVSLWDSQSLSNGIWFITQQVIGRPTTNKPVSRWPQTSSLCVDYFWNTYSKTPPIDNPLDTMMSYNVLCRWGTFSNGWYDQSTYLFTWSCGNVNCKSQGLYCGDGKTSRWKEQCDEGIKNTDIPCTATTSDCTYCTTECESKTVKATTIKPPQTKREINLNCWWNLTADPWFQDYIISTKPTSKDDAQKAAIEYSENSWIKHCSDGYSVSDFWFDSSYKSWRWKWTIRWFCKQDDRNNPSTPRALKVCRFSW